VPGCLITLLGSCIAVCLHDRHRGWGGMNHFMVPEQFGSLPDSKVAGPAIDGLVRLATMAGSTTGSLSAKLCGGASVMVHASTLSVGDIGARNIIAAREHLAALGIGILDESVGGTVGRRIAMNSGSGQVEVVSLSHGPAAEQTCVMAASGSPRKTRVLVIDDSALVRQLLRGVIATSDDFEVIGEAEDPFVARERILELDPDVLTLDLIMPRIDGLTFLRRLMQYKPIPTVVVSTIAKNGSAMFAKVKEAGAVAAIDKEDLTLFRGPEMARRILLPALRQAARAIVSSRQSGHGS